jgi:hypothetical protein
MAENSGESSHPGGGATDHKQFEIFVDGKKFTVDVPYLNGSQIKARAGVPTDYQLFLEQPGDDKQINDADSVQLKNGMHFYSVPPATFGHEFAYR